MSGLDSKESSGSNCESQDELDAARVLDAYLADLQAGRSVDPLRLVADHPAIADRLREGLELLRLLDAAESPHRSNTGVSTTSPDATHGRKPTSVLKTIWDGAGPIPQILLRDTDGDSGPPVWPGSSAMPSSSTGRYQILGEIARGGMGAILQGRDVDLGRDVAFKVLLEARRRDSDVLRRFVEEAQIGGQLQHPGIVPIYELGVFPDRRPYFAMKLVRGRTLAELLRERREPSTDRARILAIFEQVCQTMAYAHARGVIHRDLKPSNVMVGSFGEVQVMDWGLAKVLARGGVADEGASDLDEDRAVRTVRSASTVMDSHAGSVIGTPAYMSPEQARGETGRVDERSDVFGLGAILGEILTGRPPNEGRAHAEILEHAARGHQSTMMACLASCGAEAELVDLARICLAAEPDDRPRDAGVVARQVTAYLTGVQERLHAADLARVSAESRAATERTRRRLTVALAAAVIGSLALVGGGGAWLNQQRLARNARNELAMRGVVVLRDQAMAAPGDPVRWAAVLAAARQAEVAVDAGARRRAADLRRGIEVQAAAADRDRTILVALAEARLQAAAEVKGNRYDREAAARAYRKAFRAYGLDVEASPEAEVTAALKSAAIREPLAATLDDWAWRSDDAEGDRLRRIANAIDPDPTRQSVRSAMRRRDMTEMKALAGRSDLEDLPASTLAWFGKTLQELGETEAAVAVLRKGQEHYPGDLWVNHELARALFAAKPRDLEGAIRYYTAALAIQPGSPGIHFNIGLAFAVKGRTDEAIAEYRRAIELKPDYQEVVYNLGVALLNAHAPPDETIACFRRAIELKSDHAEAHSNLGVALERKGLPDEAIACFRRAIELKPDLVPPHRSLAFALLTKGRTDEAIAEFRRVVEIEPDSAEAHVNLGVGLGAKGLSDESIAEFRRAVEIKPDLLEAHVNLGRALQLKALVDEAIAEFRRAVEIKPDSPEAHAKLGLAMVTKGLLKEAIASYRRSIEIDPGYAEAHVNLGLALGYQGLVDESIAEFRRGLEIHSDAETHYNLGNALRSKGLREEAIAAYRRALELRPDFAEVHCNLGIALLDKGQFGAGLIEMERGDRLGSIRPGWRYPSAQWVRQVKRLVELDGKLPAVLRGEGRPTESKEWAEFADVAYKKSWHAASALFWKEAFAAEPKMAENPQNGRRYNAACSAALAGAGKAKDEPPPDEARRAELRHQAAEWLRADIAAWAGRLENDSKAAAVIRQTLSHWKSDPDVAGLRDEAQVAKLPEAEREAYRSLWGDVDRLLTKTVAKPH